MILPVNEGERKETGNKASARSSAKDRRDLPVGIGTNTEVCVERADTAKKDAKSIFDWFFVFK